MVGEHGTSQVFLWSSARVGGQPIASLPIGDGTRFEQFKKEIEQEVRYANITIIEGTGASVFGIGVVSARTTEIILRDERAVVRLARSTGASAQRSRCPVFWAATASAI